jgi:spermidine/putrescine transport system substrate-binding protein
MFTALTGIVVNILLLKQRDPVCEAASGAASYDVIIPSDYMVQGWQARGCLWSLISPNIPNYANISDKYKNHYFDRLTSIRFPIRRYAGAYIQHKGCHRNSGQLGVMWDQAYAKRFL